MKVKVKVSKDSSPSPSFSVRDKKEKEESIVESLIQGIGQELYDLSDEELEGKGISLEELKRGIEVEQEHVAHLSDKALRDFIARRIALDHLWECKDYYRRLDELETECENKSKE